MDPRFSILTFPQGFDGTDLHLRVLLVPRLSAAWNGDPNLAVIENFPNAGDSTAAFADADVKLEARVLNGLTRFPVSAPVDHVSPLSPASGPSPDARALFKALVAPKPGRFTLSAAPIGPKDLAQPAADDISIRKYLPQSYRSSFLFSGPRHPGAVTDDSYHCAVTAAGTPNPAFQTTPSTVNWGQIYAYCLRHHELARHLGLIREASFPIGGLFADGGFVYVDFAAGSDYAPQAAADFSFAARYAARIPRLKAGTRRPVFAVVQFPVLHANPNPPAAPGNYDQVFIEAADYDDGFAKIVHATQPVSQHLLAETPDGFPPLTDIGIRVGWDDEQILIWQSRQVAPDPTVPKIGGVAQRLDAPLGAFGYRIDARHPGDASWHSLVQVRSKGQLELDGIVLGDPPDGRFEGELAVEVHPQQFDGKQPATRFWLPAFLSQWNGTSLVLPDENAAALFRTELAGASLGKMYDPVGLDKVPLRYSETYELRVRMMDPTGGGPLVDDSPVQVGPSPVATVTFRRHLAPEPVTIIDAPYLPLPKVPPPLPAPQPPTPPPTTPDGLFSGTTLEIARPLLGYPSVVFTGKYADPMPLLQAAADAAVGKGSFGIPDPDVTKVQIDVEVQALHMDNRLSLSGREPYALLYSTTRSFNPDVDLHLNVPLSFGDAHVLHFGDPSPFGNPTLTQAKIDAMDALPLPTARDVRLTIRALAPADATYFAPGANVGKPTLLKVRRESKNETSLFAAASAATTIRGIYLQPDAAPVNDGSLASIAFQRVTGDQPAIVQRLAAAVGVEVKGLTLVGKRGERIVFGCSRGIRHTLAPDHSSLTLAAKEDLVNHWIVALSVQIDRDWTWDGLQPLSFDIFRSKKFTSSAPDDNGGLPIGDWEILPTASLLALDNADRSHTRLLFFDAVEPKSSEPQPGQPAETAFPDTIELSYQVVPRFRVAATTADPVVPLLVTLPVTTRPTQVPRIVSAGIALSKYQRNATYSATEPRRRFLWLELDQAPADPHDAYFIRPLAYAPDPLLSDERLETFAPPEESPLAIDPELVRVITPDQSDDEAGAAAMTQLVPSDLSDRHYLIPLPPGLNVDSPELFGLFTYELRVGHVRVVPDGIWSTAQGRFGRPLRSTGVQHPAPTLFGTCHRTRSSLVVEAPFAKAVLAGKNITSEPPRTELWALLYAQVRQVDGKEWRNILLDDRQLLFQRPLRSHLTAGSAAFENSDATARGATAWKQDEIEDFLAALGLPLDSSISILWVEMMPTLEALTTRIDYNRYAAASGADLTTALVASRSGDYGPVSTDIVATHRRPLSEALGQYRILRTSPLTAAPAIC